MARRRTARQITASRRNLIKARAKRSRLSKTGVLKAGVAVGAVIGGTVVARKVYNSQFTYLYHNTNAREAHLIVKQGGFSVNKSRNHQHKGAAFFLTSHKDNKEYRFKYGYSTVKYKVPKRVLKKHTGYRKPFRIDFEDGSQAVSVHPRVLKKLGTPIRGKNLYNAKQIRANHARYR